MKRLLNKLDKTNISAAVLITLLVYQLFTFSFYELAALIIGGSATTITLKHYLKPDIAFAATAAVLVYVFKTDLHFLAPYLLGANIVVFYLFLASKKYSKSNVNILNIILLAGVVFQSSIAKFRGFNKLSNTDLWLAIPLMTLSIIAIHFLILAIRTNMSSINKKHLQRIAIVTTIVLIAITGYISYAFFKEIGTETILIPILCGVVVGIIQLFITPKTSITDLNEIILLLILPYQVSGFLGISIAFLGAILYTNIIGQSLDIEVDTQANTLNKIIPMIFIFASAEIRENEGVITRFNLVSGYLTGWILISLILINHLKTYMDKGKEILKQNEIIQFFPVATLLFTIFLITIIMKFGHDEALVSLLVVISIYLFILGFREPEGNTVKPRYISMFGNIVGTITFLILSAI